MMPSKKSRKKSKDVDQKRNIGILLTRFNDARLSVGSTDASIASSRRSVGSVNEQIRKPRKTVSILPFENDQYEESNGVTVLKGRGRKDKVAKIPTLYGLTYSVGFYRPADNYVIARADLIRKNKKVEIISHDGNWVRRMLYHGGMFISTGYYQDYYLQKKHRTKDLFVTDGLDDLGWEDGSNEAEAIKQSTKKGRRPTLSYQIKTEKRKQSQTFLPGRYEKNFLDIWDESKDEEDAPELVIRNPYDKENAKTLSKSPHKNQKNHKSRSKDSNELETKSKGSDKKSKKGKGSFDLDRKKRLKSFAGKLYADDFNDDDEDYESGVEEKPKSRKLRKKSLKKKRKTSKSKRSG